MKRFIRKLVFSFRKRFIRLLHKDLCVLKADGALWAIEPHDDRFFYYYKYCAGWYYPEHKQLDALLGICEKVQPSVLIDVGANFGYYAIRLLQQFPSLTRAVAFEPVDDVLRYLRLNVLINNMQERVQIEQLAISDKKGETEILIDPVDASSNTLPETEKGQRPLYANARRQSVRMDTLDNTVNLNGETALVKIDVEGNEVATLHGAKQLLQNNACIVQIEVFNENRKEVEEFFGGLGYRFVGEVSAGHRADIWWAAPSLAGKLIAD